MEVIEILTVASGNNNGKPHIWSRRQNSQWVPPILANQSVKYLQIKRYYCTGKFVEQTEA